MTINFNVQVTKKENLHYVTGPYGSGKTSFVKDILKNSEAQTIILTRFPDEWTDSTLNIKHVLSYERNIESNFQNILSWLRLPYEDWNPNQQIIVDDFVEPHQSSQKLLSFFNDIASHLNYPIYVISQRDVDNIPGTNH